MQDGLGLKNHEGVNNGYSEVLLCDPPHCKLFGVYVGYVGGSGVVYTMSLEAVNVDGP